MKALVFCVSLLLIVLLFSGVAVAQAPTSPAELKSRIDERKARLKTKLDAAASQRISGRCVAAQAQLGVVSAKLRQANENYLPKYELYLQKVEKLEIELADGGIKSTELLNQISKAKKRYEIAKAEAARLQASLDDAAAMDCKADTVGFKAAVDDARASTKLLTDAKQDLTKYVRTTLKTTLHAVKAN